MNSITQAITQEIFQQLLQTLHQTNTKIIYNKPKNNKIGEEITYIDQNQQSNRIICLAPGHIQLQKKHTEPVVRPIYNQFDTSFNVEEYKRPKPQITLEHTHWSTRADIIIDQHNIYIYCILTPTITYELTDPNSIQNAIKTITQKL